MDWLFFKTSSVALHLGFPNRWCSETSVWPTLSLYTKHIRSYTDSSGIDRFSCSCAAGRFIPGSLKRLFVVPKSYFSHFLQSGSFHASFSIPGCHGGIYQRKLYNDLMVNYNRLERPVLNDSAPIVVELGFTLRQIIDVVSPSFVCMRVCLCFGREDVKKFQEDKKNWNMCMCNDYFLGFYV